MMQLLLADCGQEYPVMSILDITEWTCHRRKKRETEDKGKMLGRRLIWLKEDLEAVTENIADYSHCKIRGIRKVNQLLLSLINVMVSRLILAVYCMQSSHTINCPFSKYFEILYFCPNFQIFSPFLTFLCPFSEKSQPLLFTLVE